MLHEVTDSKDMQSLINMYFATTQAHTTRDIITQASSFSFILKPSSALVTSKFIQ
jgi:hypothetical protein